MLAPWLTSAAEDSGSMTVATRHVPPFAINGDDGTWHGVSIELWRDIADQLGVDYRFREMGLKEMLYAVEHKEVDAAVAALTINSERERRMDFTHPFMTTGLGIVVPINANAGWLVTAQRFFSTQFFQVVAALMGLLLLVGVLVWLLERRRNSQFDGSAVAGIGSGL